MVLTITTLVIVPDLLLLLLPFWLCVHGLVIPVEMRVSSNRRNYEVGLSPDSATIFGVT